MVEESPELQLDSVENSFSESVESSDGETVFLTSFEDSEDVTIETVMEWKTTAIVHFIEWKKYLCACFIS